MLVHVYINIIEQIRKTLFNMTAVWTQESVVVLHVLINTNTILENHCIIQCHKVSLHLIFETHRKKIKFEMRFFYDSEVSGLTLLSNLALTETSQKS